MADYRPTFFDLSAGYDKRAASTDVLLAAGVKQENDADLVLTPYAGRKVQVSGDFEVTGAETIVGGSTFTDSATFNGNVTIGDASSDTLTINATLQSSLVWADDADISFTVGGTGSSFTFSATDTVEFKTGSTPAVRLIISDASLEIQDGVTLQIKASGTGNIDLPQDGAGHAFLIGGVEVGTTVTAANLDELTDGSETTLHSHSTAGAVTSLTIDSTHSTTQYHLFTPTADGTSGLTDATGTTVNYARPIGYDNNVSNKLERGGEYLMQFIAGLTVAAGEPAYLARAADDSGNGAGRLTNDISGYSAGNVRSEVGTITDASSYGTNARCKVVWDPKTIVVL